MGRSSKRRRTDREQFWQELIQRQQQSGQSIRAFCDSQGVSQPSFFALRKRLQSAHGKTRSRFVPVQIELPGSAASPGRIKILLDDNGKRVRVEPGIDREALRDVLTA